MSRDDVSRFVALSSAAPPSVDALAPARELAPAPAPPAVAADGTLRMLDDVVAERRIKNRDCRDCKNFERDESGLNFGWCRAHKQHIKLHHHPSGEWFSQCIFKGLRRFKDQETECGGVPRVFADGTIIREQQEEAA